MEKIPSLTAVYGINETYIVEQLEYALSMAKGEVPLKEFFVNSHPYTAAALLHVAVMGLTFVIGTLQDEYSQVDRIWSLLPAFTIIMYTVHSYLNGIAASRLWIYTIIVVIWSVRLTYNFARKGGYSGVEDYRWQILRSKMTPLQFTVFSLTFISTAQIALLLSITSPAIMFYYSDNEQIGIGDIGFAYSLLACVLVEGIADDDQWRFQKAKAEFKASGKVSQGYTKPQLERGFCTTGLFGFSRHPNFLAEQMFWVLPYLWNVHMTGKYINWTIFGAVGYVLLFQASTFFTEYISTGKYPQYAEYQRTVGRFLPGFSHWKEPFKYE
ncbi:hypothetical protein BZA70DRAFT_254568 [Myxozyma melibiosi]|uniref:Steroid 5-alpha reductase C-terminal domain-containing protein n=1 Tax=Myxozyma melibiosi TaxID=54550 RepID=A0ABR1FEV6_9ASCO